MPGMANKTTHGVKIIPVYITQLHNKPLDYISQMLYNMFVGIREINVYGGASPGAFRKVVLSTLRVSPHLLFL